MAGRGRPPWARIGLPLARPRGPPPSSVRVCPRRGGSGLPRARRRAGLPLLVVLGLPRASAARVCPSLAALGLPLSRGRGRPSRPRSRWPSALPMAAARALPWPSLAPPTAARGYAPAVPLDTIRNNSSGFNPLGPPPPPPTIDSGAAVRPAFAFRHGRVLRGSARPWRRVYRGFFGRGFTKSEPKMEKNGAENRNIGAFCSKNGRLFHKFVHNLRV